MSGTDAPQAGRMSKSFAIIGYIALWAALTYFITISLFGPVFAQMIEGNINGVFDQLVGFFGGYLIMLILYLPFILFFWLLVLIYRYANSKPLFGTRKETAVLQKPFNKHYRLASILIGVAVGLTAYWAQRSA